MIRPVGWIIRGNSRSLKQKGLVLVYRDKILAILAQRGIRQAEVARQLGVRDSRISRWVNGGTRPSPAEFLALAKLLGTTIEFLVDDTLDSPLPVVGEKEWAILRIVESIGYEEAMRRLTYAGLAPWNPKDDSRIFTEALDTLRCRHAEMSRVYFVEDLRTRLIKIGFTAHITARLQNLRNDHPSIRLISVIKGGRKEERETHRLFKTLRVRGEWFLPSPLIYEYASANAFVD